MIRKSGNRFSVTAASARRYWSSGSRINDFFWVGAGGAAGFPVAGVPDASAAEAAGGGGDQHGQRKSDAQTIKGQTTLLTRFRRQHSRSNRGGEILAITPCQRVC